MYFTTFLFVARYGHQQLNKEEALELVKSTPARDESSFEFFRSLNTKGLISYTEYLFLLSLLTSQFLELFFLFYFKTYLF